MELQQIQLYKPALGEHSEQPRGFDRSAEAAAELISVDQCESIGDLDDSQLVGAPEVKEVHMADVERKQAEVKEVNSSLGKKRRGRPPGGHARAKAMPMRKKNDEEDVCFICFDGGSLVLCDRRLELLCTWMKPEIGKLFRKSLVNSVQFRLLNPKELNCYLI